jgi:hypothetical protein
MRYCSVLYMIGSDVRGSQSNYITCLSPSSKSIHYANYNVAPHDGSRPPYREKKRDAALSRANAFHGLLAGTPTEGSDELHVIGKEMHNPPFVAFGYVAGTVPRGATDRPSATSRGAHFVSSSFSFSRAVENPRMIEDPRRV